MASVVSQWRKSQIHNPNIRRKIKIMNKVRVRITGYSNNMLNNLAGEPTSLESRVKQLSSHLKLLVHMRSARKVGDEEVINHTMLGKLKQACIPFEIIE